MQNSGDSPINSDIINAVTGAGVKGLGTGWSLYDLYVSRSRIVFT